MSFRSVQGSENRDEDTAVRSSKSAKQEIIKWMAMRARADDAIIGPFSGYYRSEK
jgi:hypothetical protein